MKQKNKKIDYLGYISCNFFRKYDMKIFERGVIRASEGVIRLCQYF